MRKIQSFVVAATMIGTGLVAATGSTATAAPYPGSVNTECHADAVDSRPPIARFKATTGGNGAARGNVTFQYKRNDVVVKEMHRKYFGPGWTKYRFYGIPRGRYRVHVFFNSRPGDSAYQNCHTRYRHRVR